MHIYAYVRHMCMLVRVLYTYIHAPRSSRRCCAASRYMLPGYHPYQELTPLLRCLELLPHLASEMPRFKGDKSKGLADDVLRKASPLPSPNSSPNPNPNPSPAPNPSPNPNPNPNPNPRA